MKAALRQHIAALPADERERVALSRFCEADRLAEQLGVDRDDVAAACRELDRTAAVSGQETLRRWHESILLHTGLSATEKVAALRVWTFVNSSHLYAWPSQGRIARELGYSRGPNLGKALRRSFEIGAFTPVRIKDLPLNVRRLAVSESRRSLRGLAYRLNPVDRWSVEAEAFELLREGNMFHGGTFKGSMAHHLNYEGNYQPAAPDSFIDELSTTADVSRVETHHISDELGGGCVTQREASHG
ncbi:hypothetical protein [Martelella sp. FOR1707]